MRRSIRAVLCAVVLAAPVAGVAEPARFDCVMDPPVTLRLGAATPGLLAEVAVSRGDRVAAGQVVARLESTVERAQRDTLAVRARNESRIAAQRARLAFIENRRERVETLLARGVATQDAMDEITAEEIAARALLADAEIERALAEKELARADAMLAVRVIRSPVDGVVVERAMGPGEYLSQDVHVATVVQLDPLHIEAFLPVALYGRVLPGGGGTVYPDAPVDGAYPAAVTVVDSVFDAASGTFGVRLALANPDGALPAGHRCTVSFPGIDAAAARAGDGVAFGR